MISRRMVSKGIILATILGAETVSAATPGETNILDLGVERDIAVDNTAAFRRAIRIASEQNLGTLFIPPGKYRLSGLELRDSVVLRGAGRTATELLQIPNAGTDFITLAEGPVRYTGLFDMTLTDQRPETVTGDGPWCVNLVARPPKQGYQHGGVWNSSFERLEIRGFSGGIRLAGGSSQYMLPNQFLSFSDILVGLRSKSTLAAFAALGQVGQLTLSQCLFDVFGSDERLAGPLVDVSMASDGPNAPSLVRMSMVTVQNTNLAIRVHGSQNVSVLDSWFENVGLSIRVTGDSQGVAIERSRFANAGETVCIAFEDTSSGAVMENVFAGRNSRRPLSKAAGAKVQVSGNISTLGAGAVE